jgi:4-amino-4-deoxy-L-arabinose transferase-like glycosyltransferase
MSAHETTIWTNGWFQLGVGMWILGVVVLVLTGAHFIHGWWAERGTKGLR